MREYHIVSRNYSVTLMPAVLIVLLFYCIIIVINCSHGEVEVTFVIKLRSNREASVYRIIINAQRLDVSPSGERIYPADTCCIFFAMYRCAPVYGV